jgi:predicted PurR-regulated permease PerM
MISKRRIIIDRKFQLKTVFSILGAVSVAFILVIALTGISILSSSKSISSGTESITRSLDRIDGRIPSASINSNSDMKATAVDPNAAGDIRNEVREIQRVTRMSLHVITGLLVIVVAMCVFLYFYLLKVTNRISGPIYVMTRHINDVLEGRDPELRDLREKDELREFYTQFLALLEKFRRESD